MIIFTEKQISSNKLYSPAMIRINHLYSSEGCPERLPTCHRDQVKPPYSNLRWHPADLEREAQASLANKWLDEVYTGLGFYVSRIVHPYFSSERWKEFVRLSLCILEDFHDSGAAMDLLADITVEE